MSSKSFGQIVKDLRIKHRDYSSLRDFARKVGLSPAYLSRIENDKEPPPSESIIEKIAEALGADKYEFFSCAGKESHLYQACHQGVDRNGRQP